MHVVGVSADVAAALIARVSGLSPPAAQPEASLLPAPAAAAATVIPAPLVAFGLMQHEGKLSVVHGGLKRVASYTEPVRNKEQLLLVTGEWVKGGRGGGRRGDP